MKFQKAALVVIGVLVVAGIVMFQLLSARRPASGTVDNPQGAAQTIQQPPSTPPIQVPATSGQSPAAPIASAPNLISIPPNGWGRNPFMTLEEIAALNKPDEPQVVAVAPEPVEPDAPPELALSGIILNRSGSLAIIDSQVVRVGDHVGSEIVKEIKPGSVVLESGGKTREILLKPTGVDGRRSVPRGELQ